MEAGADQLGNTYIISIWYTMMLCFFVVRVVDTDADTYVGTQLHKVLTQYDWHNKCKYLEARHDWRRHFTSLVLSLEGEMVEETKADTKQLPSKFFNKCDRAYSAMCGYVCALLYLNLVRAFSPLVWGMRSGSPPIVIQMTVGGVEAYILVMWGV